MSVVSIKILRHLLSSLQNALERREQFTMKSALILGTAVRNFKNLWATSKYLASEGCRKTSTVHSTSQIRAIAPCSRHTIL